MYLKCSERVVFLILNLLIVGVVISSWACVLSAGLKLSAKFLDKESVEN